MATSTANKPAAPAASPTNGLAIAALVVGIVAFISGWAPFWGFIAGAAAVVLGILGLRKPGMKGMSIAGIVTGGIAALWSMIVSVFFIIAIATVGVAGNSIVAEGNGILSDYAADNKALIDAKKDFAKGETARFGDFQVTVNSVQRNYVPDNSYQEASAGNELIVVNVTVKNVSDDTASVSSYDFDVSEAGVAVSSSYLDVEPAFDSVSLTAGATVTGNIVYEINEGATDLKLLYETFAYDLNASEAKNLTFTLAF